MGELNRVTGAHNAGSTSSLSSAASTSPPHSPRDGLQQQADGGSPGASANGNGRTGGTAGAGGGAVPSSEASGPGLGHGKLRHVPSLSTLYTEGGNYQARPSRYLKLVNWWHIASVYLPAIKYALVALLVAQLAGDVQSHTSQIKEFVHMVESVKTVGISLLMKVTPLFILLAWWATHRATPIYLLDFATFKAPPAWLISQAQVLKIMRRKKCFTQESLDFMERILTNSGTGPSTAWPPGILRLLHDPTTVADETEEGAREEAEAVIYGAVQEVLDKTGVKPKEVDILIINCSLFSPTPSLCAMVVHHFGMRSDTLTYNLSGMGCSAGLISIDLAKRLLEAHPQGARALVVSTENLTQAFYHGNDRAFLLQNTLFRCGGAAVLLSNKARDGLRAKFKLLHVVRTQGTDKHAYDAVYSTQDAVGEKGVRLSKDIVKVAGRLMEKNLTAIGPKVLSVSEMSKVIASIVLRTLTHTTRKVCKRQGWEALAARVPECKVYTPDFSRCVDFYCVHAGGRGVLDGVEKNLRLTPRHLEPSRQTLYRYGNTSSSSIWYEMEYICEHMDLKPGQRVLQVAFGSGFKCNSAVWVSLHV